MSTSVFLVFKNYSRAGLCLHFAQDVVNFAAKLQAIAASDEVVDFIAKLGEHGVVETVPPKALLGKGLTVPIGPESLLRLPFQQGLRVGLGVRTRHRSNEL